MRKVIIAIHGLGNKPSKKTLTKWWKESINEGLEGIGKNIKIPEFDMIYWADILYKNPLDEKITDENDPCYFTEKYIKASDKSFVKAGKTRQKVLSMIEDTMNSIILNADYSLNYSKITDNILKKYFSDLHIYYNINCTRINGEVCKARDLIRERALKQIRKHKGKDIILVSHSMGSIIAFDTLKFLVPEIKINTLITLGSPLGLPVVLSNIAAENKIYGNEELWMCSPPGIENHWYNFSDPLDKVAFDFRLADDFAPNRNGIKPVDFIVSNNYEINGNRNPHKSYGYLRTAEFSKVLFEFTSIKENNIYNRIYTILFGFFKKKEKMKGIIPQGKS